VAGLDPARVGNLARVVVSELAGRASLTMKAAELGIDLSGDPETVGKLLNDIKALEHQGYSFETADASLEVMLKKELGTYVPFFTLESFRCLMEKREDGSGLLGFLGLIALSKDGNANSFASACRQ